MATPIQPDEPLEVIEWPEDGPPPTPGEPFRWLADEPIPEAAYVGRRDDPIGSAGLWRALLGIGKEAQSSQPASS